MTWQRNYPLEGLRPVGTESWILRLPPIGSITVTKEPQNEYEIKVFGALFTCPFPGIDIEDAKTLALGRAITMMQDAINVAMLHQKTED